MTRRLGDRIADLDRPALVDALDAQGWFHVRGLLEASECEELVDCFEDDARFERTIEMEPKGYGIGRYRYWNERAPAAVPDLLHGLYRELREAANRWRERSGEPYGFPATLDELWRRSRDAGQLRRSSILLRYEAGGVNHPHRDIYGEVWFPFQALVGLSDPGSDYEGGDFYLLEEQGGEEKKHAITVNRGDLVVFCARARIAPDGARHELRHGMDTLTRGERFALGLVFNLAE